MTGVQAINATGYSKAVAEVHTPLDVDQVIAVVKAARAAHAPLYAISRGFNWGYGSRSPVIDGCSIVDLSGMNRIRNADQISIADPVAVIEPGVTQGQLADHLRRHCPALTFNVTGSGRDTSILGNALDRGVGYLGPRKDDIYGLEVVCGTGEVLRTGFRRLGEDSVLARSHPYGLGPILDGLFSQANFGIVTSACFRLVPRRPKEIALSLALRHEEDLAAFIDELARLKREGLLSSVTHIGNKARTHATLMRGIVGYLQQQCGFAIELAKREGEVALGVVAPHEWTSLSSVSGNAAQVAAMLGEIRRRMRPLARVTVVTQALLDRGYSIAHALRFIPLARANAAAISSIRPLHALALGEPSDVAVDNLLWQFGRPDLPASELDRSSCGILYICPALPLNGRMAVNVIEGMKKVAAAYRHTLYITVNIETSSSMVAVINILFDRGIPEEAERAHRCSDALLEFIHAQGLEVYRARADMMEKIVAADPAYWALVRSLKNELDPDNIISPGRYNVAA